MLLKIIQNKIGMLSIYITFVFLKLSMIKHMVYKTAYVRCAAVAGIQLLMSAEYIVNMLPDIIAFGQTCKNINDPSLMPDLKWQTGNSSKVQK